MIKLSKDLNENVSDGIIYSVILGLRSVYIVDCLKDNKIPSTKSLKKLVLDLAGTLEPYKAYLRSKNNHRNEQSVSSEIAQTINEYAGRKIKEQKKWIRKN